MTALLPNYIIPAALSICPLKMNTQEAKAFLYTIALQESKAQHRKQVKGTAHGLWQFELIAVKDVMEQGRTRELAKDILEVLLYPRAMSAEEIYDKIVDNDILACCIARLNILLIPAPLPKKGESNLAWGQYLARWKPGRPHPETWDNYYNSVWDYQVRNV